MAWDLKQSGTMFIARFFPVMLLAAFSNAAFSTNDCSAKLGGAARSPMPIEQYQSGEMERYYGIFSWVGAQIYDVRRQDAAKTLVGYITVLTANVKPQYYPVFSQNYAGKLFYPRVSAFEDAVAREAFLSTMKPLARTIDLNGAGSPQSISAIFLAQPGDGDLMEIRELGARIENGYTDFPAFLREAFARPAEFILPTLIRIAEIPPDTEPPSRN